MELLSYFLFYSIAFMVIVLIMVAVQTIVDTTSWVDDLRRCFSAVRSIVKGDKRMDKINFADSPPSKDGTVICVRNREDSFPYLVQWENQMKCWQCIHTGVVVAPGEYYQVVDV
jgi:hypothetical protein